MFTLLIWYKKKVTEPESEKVSEPVSKKFGTEKSTGICIENIWYLLVSRIYCIEDTTMSTICNEYNRLNIEETTRGYVSLVRMITVE